MRINRDDTMKMTREARQRQDEINNLIGEVEQHLDSYKPLSQRVLNYCERHSASLVDSKVTKVLLGVSAVALTGMVAGTVAAASHQLQIPPAMLQGALAVAAASQLSAFTHFVGTYICKPFAKMMARNNFNADLEADKLVSSLNTVLKRNPHLSEGDRAMVANGAMSSFTASRADLLKKNASQYGDGYLEDKERVTLESCQKKAWGGIGQMLSQMAQKQTTAENAPSGPALKR